MGDTAADDERKKKQKGKMKEQNPDQTCSDKQELKSKKSPWKALRITASSYPKGAEVIKENECPECGKTFTRTQALGRHRRMHIRAPNADIGDNNSNNGGADSNNTETANRNVQLADDSNIQQETRKSKRKKLGIPQ